MNYGTMAELFCRMSDFTRDPIGLQVQRADSEEFIRNIHLGNTLGERDWAWEKISFEKEQLGKSLLRKVNELQLLHSEHEGTIIYQ